MLKYTLTFFLLAIITAIFGFGVMDGTEATVVKSFCALFLILFGMTLLYDPSRRRSEI